MAYPSLSEPNIIYLRSLYRFKVYFKFIKEEKVYSN